jgi:hypothetical protein
MAILKPTFAITLGTVRSQTSNPVAGMTSVVVERQMDAPVDAARIQLMERSDIALDDVVTIDLGHDEENTKVFTGNVVRLRPTIAGIEIHALGKLNVLANLRMAKIYENQTVGQIAEDLIQQAGLTAGTVDSGVTLPLYAIDSRVSAFVHVQGLARRFGFELYGDREGQVMFHALGDAASLDSAGGLAGAAGGLASGLAGGGEGYGFGKHLLQAIATQQTAALGKIIVGGESPMSRQGDTKVHWLTTQDTDHQGSAGSGAPELLLLDPLARTKDLGDRIAAGQLASRNRHNHLIQIRILGRSQLELGDEISIQDVSDELVNGTGYVRSLRHRFSQMLGFVTDVGIAVGGSA